MNESTNRLSIGFSTTHSERIKTTRLKLAQILLYLWYMRYVVILFCCFGLSARGQDVKGKYHSPLGIPLVLSSNFGELRPNHFHMGLDFKTNGREGYNLYSIADGYVSRIKVSPYGYGQVVYIDHPEDGITSVYAHCSEFKGQVDSIVRATQEKEQNFAIEFFPKPGEILLKKGEIFALSGNSGGSSGPHLHFEIRDTKTEAAMNPLLFGFDIADHKAPEIRRVKLYSITKDGYRHPGKAVSKTVTQGGSGYYISDHTITIPANYCTKTGGIGLAFDVIDRFDGANNQCGLYGSILMVDGDTIFGQQSDQIPFECTRYVNSHKDYEDYQANRRKYHKCFKTTENCLPIYRYGDNGMIPVQPGDQKKVRYVAYDAKGNKSVLNFTIEVLDGQMSFSDDVVKDLTYLTPSHPMLLENEHRKAEFGRTTVYEPLKLYESGLNTNIGEASIPVQSAYKLHVKSTAENDGKHYMEIITAKGKKRALTVTYENGWYTAESKYFGTYGLKRDVTGPWIGTPNFGGAYSTSMKRMTWKISDQQSGIADYDLFIDGKWYLLSYDYKTGSVIFNRPKELTGKHEVVVKVKDECGNVTEWKREMTFR